MTIDTTASSAAAAAKPGGSAPSGVASPTAQAQSSAPTSSSTPPTNATTTSTAAASAGWTPTAAASSRSTATYHQPPTTSTSSSPQPNVIKKSRNEVIKTIQEITKFDEFTINQAIEACQDSEGRYSMDTVLNILMDEKNLSEQQNQDSSSSTSTKRVSRPYGSSPASSSSSSSNNNNDDVPNKYSSANRSGASLHDRNNDIFGNMNNIDDEDDEDYDALMNCSSPATATATTASNINSSSQQQSAPSKPLYTTGLLIEPNLIREESKPAGLKNIGNTCWFNSIIQAFFHLPKFRNVILSFKFDQYQIDKLDDNSRNMVLFVAELRKLFALMLKSRRKTINPSATLLCLRNCSKYDVEMFNQEDVSEFSTILVNLLEESFDVIAKLQLQQQQQQQQQQQSNVVELPIHRVGEESGGDQQLANLLTDKLNIHRKNRKNPIVNLLNGDILTSRKNTDNDKTNEVVEIFREVNIQMLNSRNLYSGLELEWGETSIDKSTEPSASSSSTSTTLKSPPTDAASIESSTLVPSAIHESSTSSSIYEQESWVVKLPAVLFICLNRYKFVQATQSSSKILEPFEFYPYMYLDRYLHTNRELIKAKRKELKELKHQLAQLEQKLNSIKEYKFGEATENNSGSKYSLNEALKCVLHFATTDYTENDVFNNIRPLNVKHNEPGVEEDKKRLGEVEKCLRDWVRQLEARISNVESDMAALKHRIESIYDDDKLHRVRYNLHSVCIHEGNALSGHFWTYVWQPALAKWYKFNDTEVSESTWEDLYSNAVGGSSSSSSIQHHHHNRPYQQNNLSKTNDLSNSKPVTSSSSSSQQHLTTTLIDESSTSSTNTASNTTNKNNDKIPSAYFLIYTRAGDDTLYQENNELDVDLAKFLKDDQEALERQLNNYRLKQIYRDAVENMKRTSAQISAILKDSGNAQQSNEQMNQACMEHAKAFTDSTFEALTSSLDRIQLQASRGGILDHTAAEEALKHAVEFELARYTEEARDVQKQLPNAELRLNHILIYLSCNGVGRDVKQLALYDLFRMQVYPEVNIRMKIVQTLAHLKYNEYLLASLSPTATAAASNQAAAVFKTYEKWLFDYRDFRSIIAAFISAGNFLDSGRLEEATPFYCVACEYNERLTSYLKDKWKGMDHEFLVATRRKCLKQWNQQSIRKFSQKQQSAASSSPQQQPLSQQELSALFETMINKFLPCFFRLVTSTNEDKAFIEEIRQDWLNVLDSNLPEIQVFQDFMTKLFEDPVGNHYHSLNVNKTNLILKYRDVAIAVSQIRP